MNFVVRLRSSTSPCYFWWSVVSVCQIADLSWACLIHQIRQTNNVYVYVYNMFLLDMPYANKTMNK